jgi:hypothetical protein
MQTLVGLIDADQCRRVGLEAHDRPTQKPQNPIGEVRQGQIFVRPCLAPEGDGVSWGAEGLHAETLEPGHNSTTVFGIDDPFKRHMQATQRAS